MSAPPPVTAPPAQRRGLGTALGAAALAVATAALVVALTRHPAKEVDAAGASTAASGSATDTSAADKALCTAVAPVLADSDRVTNALLASGAPGTPARDAALPTFSTDTTSWVKQAQKVIDENPDASGFLRRSLQRYLDDSQLLAVGLRPGPLKPYNDQLYYDVLSAYDGPIAVCEKFGVKW